MDSSDGRLAMWMYLMPQNYMLKNGYHGQLYVIHILSQFLKRLRAHSSFPVGLSPYRKVDLEWQQIAHEALIS